MGQGGGLKPALRGEVVMPAKAGIGWGARLSGGDRKVRNECAPFGVAG